jgi:hypothetical protein
VSLYLDANVIVGVILADALEDRADSALRAASMPVIVSDFALAETCAVISRRYRTRTLSRRGAEEAMADLDRWMATGPIVLETTAADIAAATVFVRRLDLALRAPDAIHLAITRRLAATLLTFDAALAAAAGALDVRVATA